MVSNKGGDGVTIGENIKQFRINKGFKQSELAEISGVSRISIGYYERDERVPGTEQVEKLANALGVRPVEIMGWGYFDQTIDTTKLSNEVTAIRLFESYLSSLGYSVETSGDGERIITKGKVTAEFAIGEFDELQSKFFELRKRVEELQADNQAIIEMRIQRKAENQTKKPPTVGKQ
jgi:transcriptional regulator with XRE-family HTH domain